MSDETQNVEIVVTGSFQDETSAGAAAAQKALDDLGTTMEVVEDKATRVGKSAAALAAQFTETGAQAAAASRIQQQLARDLADIDAQVQRGTLSQKDAADSISNANSKAAIATEAAAARVTKQFAAYKAAGDEANDSARHLAQGSSLTGYQMQILGDQAHKLADQILAGGSAFKAMAYQVPNMVGTMGGLEKAMAAVGSIMSGPVGIAVGATAAVAGLGLLGRAAEQNDEYIVTLGQHLRATRDDYASMAVQADAAARQLARQPGISGSDARAAVNTFAAIPTVDASQFTGLIQQSRDLAKVMDETLPQAAEQMANALRDPEKAAEDFAQRGLLGVNEQLAQHIKALQDSGDKMGAWNLLLGQMRTATHGAAEQGLTPFQQSLENLRTSFGGATKDAEGLIQALGSGVVNAATAAINALAKLPKHVNSLDQITNVDVTQEVGGVETPTKPPQAQLQPAPDINTVKFGSLADVAAQIDAVGRQLNAPSGVISLAHRIAPVESATGQYGANGGLAMSPVGALGAMQVMPSNARGNDLTSVTGNVTAAEQLLIHLYAKYSGDETLVSMAYNWGEGNVDKYISGQISRIPNETQQYVQKVTGNSANSAVIEAQRQQTIDTALRTPDTSIAAQQEEQTRAIALLTKAQEDLNLKHAAGKESDIDYANETQKLTQRLEEHQKAALNLLTPMQQLQRQQDLAAQSANTYSAAQAAMVRADQQADQAARNMGQAHASAAEYADAEGRAQAALSGQFNASIATMDRQTISQKQLIAASGDSREAFADAAIAMKAADQARQTSIPGTLEYARQIDMATASAKANAQSTADMATAQKNYDLRDQIQMVQLETSTLGDNDTARDKAIALLQAEQDLRKRGADLTSVTSQQYLAETGRLADLTAAYKQQQDALNEIGSFGQKAFDDITQAMAQTTIAGKSSAVSFGSIWQTVLSELKSEVLKLSIINPVESAITGKSLPTLFTVGNAAFGAGSSGLGGTTAAVTSVASLGADPWGGSGTTDPAGFSGGVSGTGSTPVAAVTPLSTTSFGGLSSLGSLFNLGGGSSTAGSGGFLSNLWNTQLYGGMGLTPTATIQATAALPSGVAGPTLTPSAVSGTTIGGAITGVAGGYAVGSTVGSLIAGSNVNKQQNSQIGAAAGALAGAAIGSIIPGVGTVIGGLVGGAVGGAGGGLIGPTMHHYSNIAVDLSGGYLSVGDSVAQLFDNSQQLQETNEEVKAVNDIFTKYNLRGTTDNGEGGTTQTGVINIGGNVKGLSQSSTLADSLTALHIQSIDPHADPRLNLALSNPVNVNSIDKLNVLGGLFSDTIPNLLKAANTTPSSYDDQIKALSDNYGGAIGLARGTFGITDVGDIQKAWDTQVSKLYNTGLEAAQHQTLQNQINRMNASGDPSQQGGAQIEAFDLSAQEQKEQLDQQLVNELGSAIKGTGLYSDAMNSLTDSLAAQRQQLVDQVTQQQKALTDAVAYQMRSLTARDAAAHGDTTTSTLMNFDIQADQQRTAMSQQLVAAYGNAYTQTTAYADQMGLLNTVLADERQAQVNAVTEQHNAALRAVADNDNTIAARLMAANGNQEGADLLNWQTSARDEQAQLAQTLVNTFGDAYEQTAEYAARMTALETTQQAERAAIVKKYTDAAAEAASGSISSLGTYVSSLLTGGTSPLSARNQLALAQSQFNQVASKAAGGDYTSITQLQTYAEAYRADAQAVYGSGKGYANAVSQIGAAIGSVAGMSVDQLTASYQASLVQDQTATLMAGLAALQAEVSKLRTEVAQQTRAVMAA